MFCNNCGNQISHGSKFCSGCGKRVVINNQQSSELKRNKLFDGKIYKCPNCGAHLNAFEHKCKDCGYELRGSNVDNVVKDFADKIGSTKSVEKKNDLISNFYIPNTKEDIYEFFILAVSNLTTDSKCEEAWKAKVDQTYHKAKISFGNTFEFEYIDKLYKKTMNQYRSKTFNRFINNSWRYLIGSIVTVVALVLMIWGGFKGSESGDGDSPYYMLSAISMIIFMLGISIFHWATQKKDKSKSKVKNTENEEDEEEDEE